MDIIQYLFLWTSVTFLQNRETISDSGRAKFGACKTQSFKLLQAWNDTKFPTPAANRLFKHFRTLSILEQDGSQIKSVPSCLIQFIIYSNWHVLQTILHCLLGIYKYHLNNEKSPSIQKMLVQSLINLIKAAIWVTDPRLLNSCRGTIGHPYSLSIHSVFAGSATHLAKAFSSVLPWLSSL